MRPPQRVQTWLVLAAMAGFVAWFAAYGIRLHEAHLTAKADLGQMDLAIWNTSRGRFLQEIKDETISTRLTDHVEPIFLPVSLIFWLWNDVRALLLLQAAALALGAWPVYLLARRWLGRALAPPTYAADVAGRRADLAAWGGLAFALAYLLHPALQATAVSDFHALALAPPLIAWAFWAVEQQHWSRFTLAAVLLALVQEGMALLTALLGLYAAFRAWRAPPANLVERRRGLAAGAGMFLFGLVWFAIATFVIIPRHAAVAYGLSETPYVARYGPLGDSFAGVVAALFTRPGVVWGIASEPLRLMYVFGLLAPVAFLALLAPDILVLAAPLFLADLLSSYPLQYTGGLHYSAPLIPYVVIAGALGASRLIRLVRRSRASETIPTPTSPDAVVKRALWLIVALVVASALAWQIAAGYTPAGREFRLRGNWPTVTAHHRLLDRFMAQIPPDAALSVASDLYPHLSHRQRIYKFPTLGDADRVLVDVAGRPDIHPTELQGRLDEMLASGWGVVDAADGYLLLGKGKRNAVIPDAFYDFARAEKPRPQYPLDVTFGGKVRLLGYDLLHDLKWRMTQIRLYWQTVEPLPEDAKVEVQMWTPAGEVADDTALRPAPALVWHPPTRWRVGETVQTTTLPWYLPEEWAPAIRFSAAGETLAAAIADGDLRADADGWLVLPGWAWRGGRPQALTAPTDARPAAARFKSGEWQVDLEDVALPETVTVGQSLPVKLRWRAKGPAPGDYTVFVQLRDAQGNPVASGDGTPTWFIKRPTDGWPAEGFYGWDAHAIAVPADLAPGAYQVALGWYDLASGDRLDHIDAAGNIAGNETVLGTVRVDAAASPTDLCCAAASECCVSVE